MTGRNNLEREMRFISLAMSTVAIALMLAGLFVAVPALTATTLPERSATTVDRLMHFSFSSGSTAAMSSGILLLALVPTVRVILALGSSVRRRAAGEALVALLVFVELVVSMQGRV